MKKLFSLIIVLALFVLPLSAQTSVKNASGSSVFYTLTDMRDSTGSFYSSWIDISEFLPVGADTFVIPVIAWKASANGTAYVQAQLQGRGVGSTNSEAVLLDSVSGFWNSEATTSKYLVDLDKYKVSQVRWHLDGLAGNRADAVVRIWMNLTKGK